MVKQIADNEIYLLIKYTKSVLWRVAKRLSYIEDAWCLKVNGVQVMPLTRNRKLVVFNIILRGSFSIERLVILNVPPAATLRNCILPHTVLICLFGGHNKHQLFLNKLVCLCDGPRLSSL